MESFGAPATVYGFRDRRLEALGDLRLLPDEVINTILENLTPRDVSRLACVSRSIHYFSADCIEIHGLFNLWMISD